MLIHGVDLIEDGDMVFRHQQRTGKPFEGQSIAAWLDACPGTVLDIGAYTGIYSILAARAGAKVIAFEPNVPVYARLLENINRNSADVDAHKLAVSDYNGGGQVVTNTRVRLTSAGKLEPGNEVQVIRLDDMALEGVTAMKIDTEGHECAVIRGAIDTITRDRPLIITETLDEDAFQAQLKLLLPLGYKAKPADQWNVIWRQ